MMVRKQRGSFRQIPFWRLRARFHTCGYRDKEVAEGIGMSAGALSSRLNGHQKWSSDEIEAVCELLEIGQEEIGELFFPEVRVCEAMKAPAGLLSGRTVLRQQDGDGLPRQVPGNKKEPAGAANTGRLEMVVR